MKMSSRIHCSVLRAGLAFGFGYAALSAQTPPSQAEAPSWELNAGHLQEAALPLPSNMPTVRDVMLYQVRLSTHQEIEVQWDVIPGPDHPVRREGVAEGSLSPNFTVQNRKHNVQGSARTSSLTLGDLTLVSVAVTANGEVRGLNVGPGSPLMPVEYRNGKGGFAMVESKVVFELFLPDDPKIEKIVFLLAHPDGAKYRLEKIGTLDLSSRKPTA